MAQRCGILLLLLLLLVGSGRPVASGFTWVTPPEPVAQVAGLVGSAAVDPLAGPVGPLGTPGQWYVGAQPPGHDPSRPVLLFVHGKGGDGATWWSRTVYHGINDMYTYAFNSGYRTAYVDLHPEGDMWVNGQLLRDLLVEITQFFGVERVVIIAHSKGGVDANAAVSFYGAGPMVERVITLGAPHWGSPISDLAYSTWTWWLAALLGQRTDATYVLQPGYMAWFRGLADAVADPVPYHTVGGTRCGPFLSALWWSCLYLDGEDDGLVPIASSRKPGGQILAESRWDHDEIRMGSRTWAHIVGLLQPGGAGGAVGGTGISGASAGTTGASGASAGGTGISGASAGTTGASGASAGGTGVGVGRGLNLLLRGGEVQGVGLGEPFPIEPGVRQVTFAFYASQGSFAATLFGPDGSVHPVELAGQVGSGDPLAGAWVGGVTVKAPAAGQWRLQVSAPERAGYLMVASLESDLVAWIEVESPVARPGGTLPVSVHLSQKPASLQVDGVMGGERFTGPRAKLTLPMAEGVRNLSVVVTGTLADGSAFERSLVGSVAVVAPGWKAPWTGR